MPITEADEKLSEAYERVQQAMRLVNDVVVLECPGHDEYREDALAGLREVQAQLIELRDRLRPFRLTR